MTYTKQQIDTMLNMYFRDHKRPTPWPAVAQAIGVECTDIALYRAVWGVFTGYGEHEQNGARRVYEPTALREPRAGWVWFDREDVALRDALEGEGQTRKPPVDIQYIASVLARPISEVEARWHKIGPAMGRTGFGFAS